MKRRHPRTRLSPDLDITPFLNLMIVLVPVLLLGMVFSQLRVIELRFPEWTPTGSSEPGSLDLVVTLLPEGVAVADRGRGALAVLPARDGQQDFAGLRRLLRGIKSGHPGTTGITLEVARGIDYQTLVRAMETLRTYPAVVAASVVPGELFPDIALQDAPEGRTLAPIPEAGPGGDS
ncbi:biopolymer transporter ExbD [Marinobacter lutaoensis]|jgi:biopolymer transport protein ExbD|uniref:Biopolymer transporter ExbD n=1 Tax=Marinobacter lutaoensis TaxID=135739 RepID=A0A1V2DU91_9GAMM|nr:biopolymer transporter ExbD [Marinobacter lutaoensis]MBE03472.1 biopolymer transporter ExbD [Marinobacter sp.]MBI43597.1 biopolymer transporter ExbD [Oceanospirillales bacterium]NVD35113.1 biopolymer transporter ExbD [Marinobacter lutaoensis]ONF44248.1 biopolymer transporter ExbD [Marinobacter lutaoensis]|tara:strand:+ start:1455 stop:1985 length:531 start_codon:yes stop_codon:yes gene_type:complete